MNEQIPCQVELELGSSLALSKNWTDCLVLGIVSYWDTAGERQHRPMLRVDVPGIPPLLRSLRSCPPPFTKPH